MKETNLDKIFEALRGITRRSETQPDPQPELKGERFLIVGLGNPGREYKHTRHNIGFMLVDALASRLGIEFTRSQSKALVCDGRYKGHRIVLAKPQTYMNRSGQATQSLVKFYKLKPDHFLVAYDDVDLPFATIRLKPSGGSAGHKGMASIIKQLGTDQFPRLRMGVGRPPGQKQAAGYVLKPFNKTETDFLDNFIQRAADTAQAFISQGIEYAMTHYNRPGE
jgi:PTH1 family peptidyl-tRNA hydrolase